MYRFVPEGVRPSHRTHTQFSKYCFLLHNTKTRLLLAILNLQALQYKITSF